MTNRRIRRACPWAAPGEAIGGQPARLIGNAAVRRGRDLEITGIRSTKRTRRQLARVQGEKRELGLDEEADVGLWLLSSALGSWSCTIVLLHDLLLLRVWPGLELSRPRSCLALKRDKIADPGRRIDHFLAGVAARFERSEHLSRSFRLKRKSDREHPLLRFELLGPRMRGDEQPRESAYACERAPRLAYGLGGGQSRDRHAERRAGRSPARLVAE